MKFFMAVGWGGSQCRLRVLSEVIADNEFTHWSQFLRGGNPVAWVNAGRLDDVAINFLQQCIVSVEASPRLSLSFVFFSFCSGFRFQVA